MQQLARPNRQTHAFEDVTVTAPNMDFFDGETVNTCIHQGAIVAKSIS